jgi:hypothetical protein
MRAKAYTEEQINTMNVMPDGTYDAEVAEFHDKDKYNNPLVSKNGNPMTLVKLKVWDMNGQIHNISDYLVDIANMAFKIRHFAEATGNLAKYEAEQEITGLDVFGKRIKVVVGTQPPQPKPDGGFYLPKNVVKDYVKPLQLVGAANTGLPPAGTFEDDIKF